jgi:hypothetical protein
VQAGNQCWIGDWLVVHGYFIQCEFTYQACAIPPTFFNNVQRRLFRATLGVRISKRNPHFILKQGRLADWASEF